MKKTIVVTSLSFLLSGCILDPKRDEASAPAKPTQLLGVVSIENATGYNQDQFFQAKFFNQSQQTDQASASALDINHLSARQKVLSHLTPTRESFDEASQCELRSGTLAGREIRAQYLDVGTMSFGIASSSSEMEIFRNEKGVYEKKNLGSLSAGKYQIKTGGSETLGAFTAKWEMPEALSQVEVGGTSFEDQEIIDVEMSKDFKIKWEKPVFLTDDNIMVLSLAAVDGDKVYLLDCQVLETQMPVNRDGKLSMTLSKKLISKLPESNVAEIMLLRGRVILASSSALTAQFQGIQSTVSQAVLKDTTY